MNATCPGDDGREPGLGEGGQAAAETPRGGPVGRTAAAAVHRQGHRGRTHRAAHGRALLGAGPHLHPGHRRPDRRAEIQLHDRDRHAQHAAGRRVSDRTAFFNLAGVGQPGKLVEYDDTAKIFSNPSERPPRTTFPAASADRPRAAGRHRAPERSRPRVIVSGGLCRMRGKMCVAAVA